MLGQRGIPFKILTKLDKKFDFQYGYPKDTPVIVVEISFMPAPMNIVNLF